MSQLLKDLHNFRKKIPVPISKIAEELGIDMQKMYRFNSGDGSLKDDEAVELHKYLNEYLTDNEKTEK